MNVFGVMATLLHALTFTPAELLVEDLSLRQQLAVYKHERPRPKLQLRDRVFWVWLSRLWGGW